MLGVVPMTTTHTGPKTNIGIEGIFKRRHRDALWVNQSGTAQRSGGLARASFMPSRRGHRFYKNFTTVVHSQLAQVPTRRKAQVRRTASALKGWIWCNSLNVNSS